jgi:hypothetical protein
MTNHSYPTKTRLRASVALGAILGTALGAGNALAVDFSVGNVSGSLDSTLSIGFQQRLRGQDCQIISRDNGGCARISGELAGKGSNPDINMLNADSGNLNYKRGDIVSLVYKGTHDLSLKGPNGWSSLIRGTWSGDAMASNTERTPLEHEAKLLMNPHAELLDAYVAKSFNWLDNNAKVKVGNQVVSWGEDIFIPGGVNVINAIDFRKLHVPGTQLKEVFKPAPMIYVSSGLTDALSVEAYYQMMWNSYTFDPVGTFFSTSDVVGPGRRSFYLPASVGAGTFGDEGTRGALGTPVPGLSSHDAPSQGQFGTAFRYRLGITELGLYYLHYHDKLPQVSFTGTAAQTPTGFFNDYGTDRDLFGASANSRLGPVAVGAELSYRPRDSVGIDPTVPASGQFTIGTHNRGFVEEKKWQGHLTANYLFQPNTPLGNLQDKIGATDGYILAEAAAAYYPNLIRDGSVPYLLPNYSIPDRFSWGYVAEIGVVYPEIFGTPVNMVPMIDFAHDVSGTTPNGLPFIQDRKSLAFGLTFNYQDAQKLTFTYATFWGGGDNNLMRDRDFWGANYSVSF